MTDAFAKAAEIGRKMEAGGQSLKDRINVYACTPSLSPTRIMQSGCLHWIVTVDREAGVTPMFVKCGHCGGTASSRMYKVGEGLEPTHEWYRPASEAALPADCPLERVADHLQNGGLLMRPIGDGKWIEPTPEVRAFVADEQRRLRGAGFAHQPKEPPPEGCQLGQSDPAIEALPTRQQRRHAQRKGLQ